MSSRSWSFLRQFLSGGLTGAACAVVAIVARESGLQIPPLGWWALVLMTLALFLLGRKQRQRLKAGLISSASFPRGMVYLQTTVMWVVLMLIGLWVLRGHEPPFDRAAFAWPSGISALIAFGIVAAVVGVMIHLSRLLPHDRRKRAWVRTGYRHGVSLIAPRTPRELQQFRASVCLTSTAEEVVYRIAVPGGFVVLLDALGMDADGWWTIWVAAAASALLFGVAHAWQGAAAVGWTTMFGLVAAALMLGTGSVWPAVALHIGWNIIVGGMMHTVYGRHMMRAGRDRP